MDVLRRARRQAGRIERGPVAWSVLAVVVFLVVSIFGLPVLWAGMALAVPLTLFATGLGWRIGALLVPAALGLVLVVDIVSRDVRDPWQYLGLAAVAAFSVAAGHNRFVHWRRAEQSARANERRAELLSQAAASLHLTHTPQELYRELVRLLSVILDVSHTSVLVPRAGQLELVATHLGDLDPGHRLSMDSVCGAAFRSGEEIYVADTRLEPRYVAPPNAPVTLSEVAVPLIVGGESVAVLNLEHREAHRFGADERATLRALKRIAEEALARIRSVELLQQQRGEQEFLAHLNHSLLSTTSTHEVASVVLRELQASLQIDGGAVLTLEGARFRPVADVGSIPAEVRSRVLASGLPWGVGQIYQSWVTQEALFITDYQTYRDAIPEYRAMGLRAVAFVPIVNAHGRTQALLEFGSFERAREWRERDRALLAIVASTLGVAFERAVLEGQMVELLDIVRGLAQTDDPRQLYQDAVAAAVKLVPGAEAGSILVRTGEGFRFAAMHGFDEALLDEATPFKEAEQLRWYAGSVENFRKGVPRLATGGDVRRHSEESRRGRMDEVIASRGRIGELQANICVPIAYQNEVTGILNIDNLTHEGAFGVNDLRLAEAFGQQVGVIIRQAEYREALERSVVTDPLTGLGNREGFNQRLTAEISRAKRYGHAVHLVVMDLDGFKAINDRFGHQTGDEALIRVAAALEDAKREGDSAFRWGGDEFALIIPQVAPADARRAATRYAAAIESVGVDDATLSVSLGVASYPQDAAGREELLQIADDLMYERKKQRAATRPAVTRPNI